MNQVKQIPLKDLRQNYPNESCMGAVIIKENEIDISYKDHRVKVLI